MQRRWRGCCSAAGTKWAAMAATVWIEAVVSSANSFAIYSPLLKSSQGYDQSTLDTVANAADIGTDIVVPAGLLLSHFGDLRLVLIVGALHGTVGYLLLYLSMAGALLRPPVALVFVSLLTATQTSSYCSMANLVCAIKNFPDHRATAIGIQKGFVGLSSAILVQIYLAFFDGDQLAFVLMLALLPAGVTLLLTPLVRVHRSDARHDKPFLDALMLVASTVAAYLTAVVVAQRLVPFLAGVAAQRVIFFILLLLLSSPAAIAVRTHNIAAKELAEEDESDQIAGLIDNGGSAPPDHAGDSPTLLQALCSVDFWLLAVTVACGLGSGLAAVDNISQIGASLGYTSSEVTTVVSLWGIWSFVGRVVSGYLSDHLLRSRGRGRPLVLASTFLVMSAGHSAISIAFPGALYVGSALISAGYGAGWVLTPSITFELLGPASFGAIYSFLALAEPVGSYALSVKVIGYMYDREAVGGSGHSCVGAKCFTLSFAIVAGVCLVGCAAAIVLWVRTKKLYEDIVSGRREEEDELAS